MILASSEDIKARSLRIADTLRRELGDHIGIVDIAAHLEIAVNAAATMGLPLEALVERVATVYWHASAATTIDVEPSK